MVPNENNISQVDSEVVKAVLDEALGQVKATAFTVLYTIGQLTQQNPGKPITVPDLCRRSGVGERTVQGIVTQLRKQLRIDYVETARGNVYEFLEPIPVSEPEPQLRGRNLFPIGTTTDLSSSTTYQEKTYLHRHEVSGHTTSIGKPGTLFDPQIHDLAKTFRSYAAPFAKKKITPDRLGKFVMAAHFMVTKEHIPVAEIHQAIAFVFENWSGVFPFPVDRGQNKVTSLWQIANNWDRIRNLIVLADRVDTADHFASKQVDYLSPLPDVILEGHARELTSLFKEFRTTGGDTWMNGHRIDGWTKTFRIMLYRDQTTFADIRTLLEAMTFCRDFVERGKYLNAFDVRTDFQLLFDYLPELQRALQSQGRTR